MICELVALMKEHQLTLGAAESLTGGLISSEITSVPGASSVFWGGFVTYASEAKNKLLGVSSEILNTHGAVSSQCAQAMVQGVLKHTPVDYALAVTGFAGPEGVNDNHPVGTVFIGVGNKKGELQIKKQIFSGSRNEIRLKTADAVFVLLKDMINCGLDS